MEYGVKIILWMTQEESDMIGKIKCHHSKWDVRPMDRFDRQGLRQTSGTIAFEMKMGDYKSKTLIDWLRSRGG